MVPVPGVAPGCFHPRRCCPSQPRVCLHALLRTVLVIFSLFFLFFFKCTCFAYTCVLIFSEPIKCVAVVVRRTYLFVCLRKQRHEPILGEACYQIKPVYYCSDVGMCKQAISRVSLHHLSAILVCKQVFLIRGCTVCVCVCSVYFSTCYILR